MELETLQTMAKQLLVAGVDEAGRGALVGRVYAAAVILDKEQPISFLNDSKKISEKKRFELAEEIKEKSKAWSIGYATAQEIDDLNIHNATLLAMQRSLAGLKISPELVLVDGKFTPQTQIQSHAVVKGDTLFPCISAASILAKTQRDKTLIQLDEQFPEYEFAKHKGYPTKDHIAKLTQFGVFAEYRKSYAPVRKILEQTQNFK